MVAGTDARRAGKTRDEVKASIETAKAAADRVRAKGEALRASIDNVLTALQRAWLAAHIPHSPRTCVVHGDYKLDNVVLSPDGAVAAILDWEMSTLGDPLADLGWLLSFWREAHDPIDEGLQIAPRVTEAPGFPKRRELIARYESATGLRAENLTFYEALAVWKLAILLEGSYARHLLGADQYALDFDVVDRGKVTPARHLNVESCTTKEIDGRGLETALGNAQLELHHLPPYTCFGS